MKKLMSYTVLFGVLFSSAFAFSSLRRSPEGFAKDKFIAAFMNFALQPTSPENGDTFEYFKKMRDEALELGVSYKELLACFTKTNGKKTTVEDTALLISAQRTEVVREGIRTMKESLEEGMEKERRERDCVPPLASPKDSTASSASSSSDSERRRKMRGPNSKKLKGKEKPLSFPLKQEDVIQWTQEVTVTL